MVPHRVDAASGELGREALAVPVRQSVHHDDGLFDPGRHSFTVLTAWPMAESGQVLTDRWSRWSATLGREEQESGAFLVGVAKWTTVWVRACTRHLITLLTSIAPMPHQPRELHLGDVVGATTSLGGAHARTVR